MSNLKPIRKIECSVDRKFPTTIEYGSVDFNGSDRHYLLHTESRHWDENFYVFPSPELALKAMGLAACNLGLGLEVPREFEGAVSTSVKF